MKSSAIIKYINLEHGQLKYKTICQYGTNHNTAVQKYIPISPVLLHCINFQYHLNALKKILLGAKLPHITILRSHQLPVWMHLMKTLMGSAGSYTLSTSAVVSQSLTL